MLKNIAPRPKLGDIIPPSPGDMIPPAPVPGTSIGSQAESRTDLTAATFAALGGSGKGYLTADEMLPFARHTGFDGTDREWRTEFEALLKECGSTGGVTKANFEKLVNDKSDAGCYCSDAELRSVLLKLSNPERDQPSAIHQPSPVKTTTKATSTRAALTSKVFIALNLSGNAYLSADEMRPFAKETGFDGTDQQWRREFELLKQECKAGPGISLEDFQRLANDQSDDGCYCSDSELQALLTKLESQRTTTNSKAPPTVQHSAPSPAVPNGFGKRDDLLQRVFKALNLSGNGHLASEEMRPFAEATGFDGNDHDWKQEFELLKRECKASGPGISLEDFKRLANDQSEDGCYCSDSDLQALLARLELRRTTQNSRATPAVQHSAPSPAVPKGFGERVDLLQRVFKALNSSGNGYLASEEMRPFAEATGFDGSDQDWKQEFELLKQECKAGPGISLEDFKRLANDQSDDGCYCTDSDLQALLARIESLTTQNSRAPPAVQHPAPSLAVPNGSGGREDLLQRIFKALNLSGKGYLASEEMRPFAEATGFDGSDLDWKQEFELLKQECKAGPGISLEDFKRLANDQSDDGCYCSDSDLQALLARLESRRVTQNSRAPPTVQHSAPSPAVPNGFGKRDDLLQRVFKALNLSGNGHLASEEMRPFAEATGFDGNDQDWKQEFELLKRECKASGPGISLEDFKRLANDQSDDGCFCSDSDLQALLARLESRRATKNSRAPPTVQHSAPSPAVPNGFGKRDDLLQRVFKALNFSGNGYLASEEMRPFAEATGFDGSDQDWKQEFELLKQECKAGPGISLEDFKRLANDQSDDGCYCSDSDLQALLARLESRRATQNSGEPPAVQHSAPSPTVPNGSRRREDLLQRIFKALNWSGNGYLASAEMRPFAEATGFDGSDQDWKQEFELLKQECKAGPGISLEDFKRLANDQSDDGCYCSDSDLLTLLARLDFQRATQNSRAAPTRHAVPKTPAPNDSGSRDDLLRMVFSALNASGSGLLDHEEMLPFAEFTAFKGSKEEWEKEFALLKEDSAICLDAPCLFWPKSQRMGL